MQSNNRFYNLLYLIFKIKGDYVVLKMSFQRGLFQDFNFDCLGNEICMRDQTSYFSLILSKDQFSFPNAINWISSQIGNRNGPTKTQHVIAFYIILKCAF